MKGKSIIVAIFMLFGALSSFTVWQDGNTKQLEVSNLGFLKNSQQNLVIQYGNKFFWITPENKLVKQVDLSEFGLHIVGDYDFFANGDLLIYHRVPVVSLLDTIKSYSARLLVNADATIDSLPNKTEGFYRCKYTVKQCVRFGDKLPAIEGDFRINLDLADDKVYLADSSANTLYKISSYGTVITSVEGSDFKQITARGNDLWIADSNNHRIVNVSTYTEKFADVISHVDTLFDETSQLPQHFVVDGASLWVNSTDSSLSNGVIQQYNLVGKALASAVPQHVTKPTSMVIWQDTLLVADDFSAQIEQFNLQGESTGLYTITPLQHTLEERQSQLESAQLISQYGQLGFTITLILGGILTWKSGSSVPKPTQNHTAYQQSTAHSTKARPTKTGSTQGIPDAINQPGVVWLTNNVCKYKSKIYKIALLYVLPIISLFVGFNVDLVVMDILIDVIITYSLLALILLYLMNYLTKIKVGVYAGNVYLYARKKLIIKEFDALTLSSGYIFCEDFVIPIGSSIYLFERVKLQELVLSKLTNKVSNSEGDKRLWKLKEPLFMSILISFLVLFIVW